MGFLENFQAKVRRYCGADKPKSSFDGISKDEIDRHLAKRRYGDFIITDAVIPSYDLQVVPQEGYRFDKYVYEDGHSIPALVASVSRERLFQVFMNLIGSVGPHVDVRIRSFHNAIDSNSLDIYTDFYRSRIDMSVLQSMLWDYEDMLTNDGCAGISVVDPSSSYEIQFDEHKVICVYGDSLTESERIIRRDIAMHEDMQFIYDAEHIHKSCDRFRHKFLELVETIEALDDNKSVDCDEVDYDQDDDWWEDESEEWKDDGDIDLGDSSY